MFWMFQRCSRGCSEGVLGLFGGCPDIVPGVFWGVLSRCSEIITQLYSSISLNPIKSHGTDDTGGTDKAEGIDDTDIGTD